MAHYRANGYDLVLELHEDVVAGLLVGDLPAGLLTSCSGAIQDDSITGLYSFIRRPGCSTSLDTAIEDGIHLDIPFHMSVAIESPEDWPDTGNFTGQVGVTARLTVNQPTAMTTCLAIDFSSLERDQVAIERLDALDVDWARLESEVRNLIEEHVYACLLGHDSVNLLPTVPIDPDNDGSDPFTPTRADSRVIRDGATRSVAVLFPTQPDVPDNLDAFTSTVLGPADQAVAIVGNELLLRRFIGARVLENLELYDPAADSIDVLHGLLEYHDNRVTLVDPPVFASHLLDEWWASGVELRVLDIEIDEREHLDMRTEIFVGGPLAVARATIHLSGEVEVVSATQITVHLHLAEPEVDIGPTLLAFMMGGVLAFIVFAFNNLVSRLLFAMIDDVFDDCTLVGLTEWPEEPQPVDIDCNWFPTLPIPLLVDDVVLDDCVVIGRPDLPDVDPAWPQPRVEIVGDWEVTNAEFGNFRTYPIPRGTYGIGFEYREGHRGEFRAIPSGPVEFPIDYAWCLGGHDLNEEGSVTIGETTVSYTTDDDRCELVLETGDSLRSELCVSALDHRGVELYAQRYIDIVGSEPHRIHWGVEKLEGPPPYLEGPLYATQSAWLLEFGPAEGVSISEYKLMMRSALMSGMDVDPADPSVHRGES
jgi:hypothetical protein